MNEIDQIRAKHELVRITALCVFTFVVISALCLTLFFRNYADPAVLTAIISIASTLIGALANRSQQQQASYSNGISSPPATPASVTTPEPTK